MNATAKSHSTKQINMSMDEFIDKFRPAINHIDTTAGFNGSLYETFGAEVAYVRQAPSEKVWTMLESDGNISVTNGFHFVNALGYLITEVSAEENSLYNIEDDEVDSLDENEEH